MSKKIIAWADKEREKLEGVGLSDDLVSIVEGVIKRTKSKWKYIDQLQTYDDRHQAFTNELDNLLARCFGDNTFVLHKGDTVHIDIYEDLVDRDLEAEKIRQELKRGELT